MDFTTETLARYLGAPTSMLLAEAPFKDWIFEKSFETDLEELRIDYVFPEGGVALICDGDDRLNTIFLYANRFEGDLPDLPFASKRQEVIKRFGAPSKSGGKLSDPILGDYGPWDRFARYGYSIHVAYAVDADTISRITLMRDDVVPA